MGHRVVVPAADPGWGSVRLLASPRVRGEAAALFARRVRGTLRESECVESPPHPDLLPASGEKEK
jgi:hypothetical protein